MKSTWRLLSASLLLAPLVGCAQKPASPPPSAAPPPQAQAEDQAPPAGPGVAKGQPAPSFKLKDQKGVEHSLDEMLQSGIVAVVFFRSADW
jgi:hypothetical protein